MTILSKIRLAILLTGIINTVNALITTFTNFNLVTIVISIIITIAIIIIAYKLEKYEEDGKIYDENQLAEMEEK